MLRKNLLVGYRKIIGVNQKDLAEYLNISRQAYSMKECGKIPFKDEEKIKVVELLKKEIPEVSVGEIFFGGM